MAAERTSARFPQLPRSASHYESFYLKACHQTEPLALWVRHTVGAPGGGYIVMGASIFTPASARGSAEGEGRSASWDLTFDGAGEPFRHLPRDWMYRAPLPRTKLLSPHPDVRFSGSAEVGGQHVDLRGWRGMVGHNWGAQHAERWIWMHGAGFSENDDAWIDAALGRIKVGPFTTPWIANAVLSMDGIRHRLGGPVNVRTTEVRESPEGCEFVLAGEGVTVQGRAGASRVLRGVGLRRSRRLGAPHGELLDLRHGTGDIASVRAVGLAAGRGGRRVRARHAEHDHGMTIEPFSDG